MKQLDKFTGIFFIAAGVFLYPMTGKLIKESAAYTKTLLILLIITGAWLLVESIIKSPKFSFSAVHEALGDIYWGRTLFSILFSLAYVITLPHIGFIVGSLIYMIVLLFVLGVRKPIFLTLLPVGMTAALYVVFVIFLKIRLPQGILNAIL